MKEKKVDVYLAKAGFFQVMFYGFGGTFVTELMRYNDARWDVLYLSSSGTLAS